MRTQEKVQGGTCLRCTSLPYFILLYDAVQLLMVHLCCVGLSKEDAPMEEPLEREVPIYDDSRGREERDAYRPSREMREMDDWDRPSDADHNRRRDRERYRERGGRLKSKPPPKGDDYLYWMPLGTRKVSDLSIPKKSGSSWTFNMSEGRPLVTLQVYPPSNAIGDLEAQRGTRGGMAVRNSPDWAACRSLQTTATFDKAGEISALHFESPGLTDLQKRGLRAKFAHAVMYDHLLTLLQDSEELSGLSPQLRGYFQRYCTEKAGTPTGSWGRMEWTCTLTGLGPMPTDGGITWFLLTVVVVESKSIFDVKDGVAAPKLPLEKDEGRLRTLMADTAERIRKEAAKKSSSTSKRLESLNKKHGEYRDMLTKVVVLSSNLCQLTRESASDPPAGEDTEDYLMRNIRIQQERIEELTVTYEDPETPVVEMDEVERKLDNATKILEGFQRRLAKLPEAARAATKGEPNFLINSTDLPRLVPPHKALLEGILSSSAPKKVETPVTVSGYDPLKAKETREELLQVSA